MGRRKANSASTAGTSAWADVVVFPDPESLVGETEGQVQRLMTKGLELLGAKVYNLSQQRVSRQTPGLPDLFAFVPLPSDHVVGLWVEAKRRRRSAPVRPEQQLFRAMAKLAGIEHVVGDLRDVIDWCVRNGLVQPDAINNSASYVRTPQAYLRRTLEEHLTQLGPLVDAFIDSLRSHRGAPLVRSGRRR